MTKTISGDVEIELDGETHILRPSLEAATAISREWGGINGAMAACMSANVDAFQSIIKASIVTADRISTKDLKNHVWRAGMANLSKPVSRFLGLLQTGGKNEEDDRKVSADTDDDEGNGRRG